MTESTPIRMLLDHLSDLPTMRTHPAARHMLLTAYCDLHLDDNDADNDDSIYAAARAQLQRLRTLINSGDDLDSANVLHAAELLADIDTFITDESR